jgi:hypothetical protein
MTVSLMSSAHPHLIWLLPVPSFESVDGVQYSSVYFEYLLPLPESPQDFEPYPQPLSYGTFARSTSSVQSRQD